MKYTATYIYLFLLLIFSSCGTKSTDQAASDEVKEVRTPVTITTAHFKSMSDAVVLNATSAYQRKNTIKSNINGFIDQVFINPGEEVAKGKLIYIIKTREAQALKEFKTKDSSFQFQGIIKIYAPSSGIITDIYKHVNDYINEGEIMANLADRSSFVFIMNVPFELAHFASTGSKAEVILPDSSRLNCLITGSLGTVDPVSQTLNIVLHPTTSVQLPENLNVSVRLIKYEKKKCLAINRSAILSDETMSENWIMKLINDSTAIRVNITTGLRDKEDVEIISPLFDTTERFLLTGGYGLRDTASIKIHTN
jgi:biotin carboxyl carrier protein